MKKDKYKVCSVALNGIKEMINSTLDLVQVAEKKRWQNKFVVKDAAYDVKKKLRVVRNFCAPKETELAAIEEKFSASGRLTRMQEYDRDFARNYERMSLNADKMSKIVDAATNDFLYSDDRD